jgi:hypothetical protein
MSSEAGFGHCRASFLAIVGNGRRERAYPCVAPQLLRLSHLLGGNMTNRFLFALVVLSSFLEVTFPAGALPVPVATLAIQSTDATGAFILVKKGKGHGDREDRFEWRRHGAYRFSHHRGHPHGMRGFNGNQGFGNYSGFGGGNQNQPDGQN